jgi:hypothetical protein
MQFVQLVGFTTDNTVEELLDVEAGWRERTRSKRTGVIEWFLTDRSDPRRKFAINGFPDAEAAAVNSALPETDALAEAIGLVVDGDLTFHDCDFVDQAADERDALARGLAEAMATGKVPPDVFADDVFFDMNVPAWRYQLQGVDTLRNMLATEVAPGAVESIKVTPTIGGFVLELSTRDPQHMYRQLLLVQTRGGLVSEVTMYCTGPWNSATEARQQAEAPMIRRD